MGNLNIETAVTEEEAAERLEVALETQEMEVEGDGGSEGDEGGGGTQRALESLEFLTQDAEPSGTTLVDARNGFDDLSRLEMLWTVQHCCLAFSEICVQLLQALGTTSPPPDGGAASYNPE